MLSVITGKHFRLRVDWVDFVKLRQIVFRVMLWSLAFAAVGGALAALFMRGATIGRVIGTGVLVSLACALMMPVARAMEKPEGRVAAFLGMCLIIAELLASLVLVWRISIRVFGLQIENEIGASMFVCAVGGALLAAMLRLANRPGDKLAGVWGSVFLTTAWLFGLISVWKAGRVFQDERFVESSVELGTYGILTSLCLMGVRFEWRRSWRWLGVVSLTCTLMLMLSSTWLRIRPTHAGELTVVYTVTFGLLVALASLFEAVELRDGQAWLRRATMGCAVFGALFSDWAYTLDTVYGAQAPQMDILIRLAGAGGILTCCGVLAMLVLSRMNKRVESPAVLSELRSLEVVCPGCQRKQSIEVGGSVCEGCGLRMNVQIAEPRCSRCDYLLFGQRYERCPECGETVSYDTMARRGWAVDG